MEPRILDLDGSLRAQPALLQRTGASICPMDDWAPRIRLGCSSRRFGQFEQALAFRLGSDADDAPRLNWYGSGDFHHVTLALLRRRQRPFNLVVIDNHPDWMRRIPILHCGTWLWHAAQLPQVQRIFHVGGDVDFDNYYRWVAPWQQLRSGKITVCPSVRKFARFPWTRVTNEPLRARLDVPATFERIMELLAPFRADLARWPLYVSLDKDVMVQSDSIVNWDSGHLRLDEVLAVLEALEHLAQGRWAGMDVLGDWSPVRLQGWLRHLLHFTEHPPLTIDAEQAATRNEQINLALCEGRALRRALHFHAA